MKNLIDNELKEFDRIFFVPEFSPDFMKENLAKLLDNFREYHKLSLTRAILATADNFKQVTGYFNDPDVAFGIQYMEDKISALINQIKSELNNK